MIPAGHMRKCLWARAQSLPVQGVRNTAGSSLIPETTGLAGSREGEEMGIFIKNPPFLSLWPCGVQMSPKAVWKAARGCGSVSCLSEPGGQDGASAPT